MRIPDYLISGQNVSGTGTRVAGCYWSDKGYILVESSGNSATAVLEASPDGTTRWMNVTSWTPGVNATATAQLTGFYPFLRGGVVWASGGTNTALVNIIYVGRMQGV